MPRTLTALRPPESAARPRVRPRGGALPAVDMVLRSWGGDYLNKECTLTSPAAIDALQRLADVRNEWNVAPRADQLQGTNEDQLWYSGRIASRRSGPWHIAQVKTQAQIRDWDVALTPKGKAARVSDLTSAFIVIPAGVKDADASWQWVKFYKSAEAETLLAQRGTLMPTRKPVADSGVFLSAPPANMRAFVEMVQYGRHLPQVPRWSEVLPIINKGLAPVLNGEQAVHGAVTDIKRQVDPILRQPLPDLPKAAQ